MDTTTSIRRSPFFGCVSAPPSPPPPDNSGHDRQYRIVTAAEGTDCHISYETELSVNKLNDSSADFKGKNVKPMSEGKAFCEMLIKECCPITTEASQQTRQEKSVLKQYKKLIEQSVNQYVKTLKLAKCLSSKELREQTWLELLDGFVKSPQGERLYRKAVASNMAGIEKLLRGAGVNIDHQSSKSGNTPLIAAALNNHWDMVLTLIDAGARPDMLNKDEQHILGLIFEASSKKKIDNDQRNNYVVKILKQHGGKTITVVDKAQSISGYAAKLAALRGDVNLLQLLVNEVPRFGRDLELHHDGQKILVLLVTSDENLSKVVRYILQAKYSNGTSVFNPYFKTTRGDTPLMLAAKYRKLYTMQALLEDPNVRKDIDLTRRYGGREWSAYTYAHSQNNVRMMRLLLNKGASNKYLAPPPPSPSQLSSASGSSYYRSTYGYNSYAFPDSCDYSGGGCSSSGGGGGGCGGGD